MCRRCLFGGRFRPARSPPHWCVRSQAWAATCRHSCRHRSRPASRQNSPASRFLASGVFMIRIFAFVAALICAAPAIAQPLPANLDKQNAIVIDTSKGRIVFKLRTDLAPQHAERIKQLAREGYYNNVPFHRVMDGFMAQTGDGQNFNGTGGSEYTHLNTEFFNVPVNPRNPPMGARGDSLDTA